MKNVLKSDFLMYYMYTQTNEHIHKEMFKLVRLKWFQLTLNQIIVVKVRLRSILDSRIASLYI